MLSRDVAADAGSLYDIALSARASEEISSLSITNISFIPSFLFKTLRTVRPSIWDGRTATLQMLHFIYFFLTTISTEYFKHAAHSLFFSSKCRLFHNATFWFLYYSHFTYRAC
jgi:hypothetical protein